MEKNAYVCIETVYEDKNDRNLEYLSKQYDENILQVKVKSLIGEYLTNDRIRGKKILIKPNWVRHCSKPNDKWCLCTNESLILVVVKLLTEMHPASILIADAPIQGCDWDRLLSEYFVNKCKHYSEMHHVPIIIKDFRKVIYSPNSNTIIKDDRSNTGYVICDMGKNSYLEPITDSGHSKFRVTCYNPEEMANVHKKGVHKYCIAKEVFDADIILTMPKMKTHQKAGITNAMKILVGVNGDKAFLPHHRIGASGYGGDCYPGKNILRSMSERVLDKANKHIGEPMHKPLNLLAAALWKLSNPSKEQNLAAAWYGNDTVWRMVMDINHIVRYGKLDGSISAVQQRCVYSLCDGIIGGQGNGPLSPEPLALGVLAFSNNSYYMDIIMGHLFSLQIEKIPNLKAAEKMINYNECKLIINQKNADLNNLKAISVDVKMAPGWEDYERKLI